MIPKNRKPFRYALDLRATITIVSFAWALLRCSNVTAENFLAEFEGPETSWKVPLRSQGSRPVIHQRRRGVGKEGGAEFIRLKSIRENSPAQIEHAIPPTVVLDELELSVWVKSNRDGFTLATRITLPDVLNPKSNLPLTIEIEGDQYNSTDQWQQLKCRTTDRSVRDKLRLLRALHKIPINPSVMFVDSVLLIGQLPPGETDLYLDHLEIRPFVRYAPPDRQTASDSIQQVNQSSDETSAPDSRSTVPVEFQLHRLFVDKKPFFPRILAYQQERPEILASAGINVAWVSDYENSTVALALRRQGLWITATPPFAKGTDGEPLDSDDASLMPFQPNSSSVLFWMLGARMSSTGHPRLPGWTNQIRNADRRFKKRPIAADVIEDERLCSRHLDLLGISRHVIHTNFSLADYRDWMIQRRDQAWPDTFCWTWIQTEPSPSLNELVRGTESPPMLEPEQIRLQVYAALAVGCRGLGYWTTTPLDHDSPAAKERLLTLKQLNMELDLFEPWITSGSVPQLVSFKVDGPRNDLSSASIKTSRTDLKSNAKAEVSRQKSQETELQAAMFRSEHGALLLPMWLEENAQFVPGPIVANNVTIIIPAGGDTASAWEITTTGQLRHLDREPVAGGVKVKLARFDQTAAILITSKPSSVDDLNQKILSIQEQSARVCLELAKLKLERIRQVDQSLQNLGVGRKDAWQLLGDAKIQLDKAEAAFQSQQPNETRQYASRAMQLGRHLQRAYWENAVHRLSTPTSTPWAVSFQSLPEYWQKARQVEVIGSPDAEKNLLPSGEFEDVGTLIAEHWTHEQSMLDTIESTAGLFHAAKQGEYSLRISARPANGETLPGIISKPPVTMISPGVSVRAGQFVRISGWVKIPEPIQASLDGVLIYDSLLGKSGAVRLKAKQDWKRFELLRPALNSQEMTITISMNGLGEVLVDDLKISVMELGAVPSVPTNKSSIAPAKYSPLDIRRLTQQKKP